MRCQHADAFRESVAQRDRRFAGGTQSLLDSASHRVHADRCRQRREAEYPCDSCRQRANEADCSEDDSADGARDNTNDPFAKRSDEAFESALAVGQLHPDGGIRFLVSIRPTADNLRAELPEPGSYVVGAPK